MSDVDEQYSPSFYRDGDLVEVDKMYRSCMRDSEGGYGYIVAGSLDQLDKMMCSIRYQDINGSTRERAALDRMKHIEEDMKGLDSTSSEFTAKMEEIRRLRKAVEREQSKVHPVKVDDVHPTISSLSLISLSHFSLSLISLSHFSLSHFSS